MHKRYVAQIFLAITLLFSTSSFAEEESESKLAYFTLEPDLTTNFYTKGKKLGYIQVRLDIMVLKSKDLSTS